LNKGLVRDEVNAVLIEVDGVKDGKEVKHTMYHTTVLADSIELSPLSSVVGYCTAQCGVTVALMLLRGRIARKGVMTPDRLESPEKILATYVAETAMRIDEKIERKW